MKLLESNYVNFLKDNSRNNWGIVSGSHLF